MPKFRVVFTGIVFSCALFLGYRSYIFFFDHRQACLTLQGIKENGSYTGDIACCIRADKKGTLSVWVDNQLITTRVPFESKKDEHTFSIPASSLTNGHHELRAEFSDATYAHNKTTINQSFCTDNIPLQAAIVKANDEYKVFQGKTLHVQFQANKELKDATVKAFARNFRCFPEAKEPHLYECFIPIACEELPNEYLLSVELLDHVGNQVRIDSKFHVVTFPFKKSKTNVSSEKIKQEQELGLDDQNFERLIAELTEQSSEEKLWKGPFCTPIDIQRTTCEFGTIRTTQYKGRYAHKAIDIINAPKSVVWAAQEGIIRAIERFAGSGNTVILDHGRGLLSIYCHLDSFANIVVGDKIAQGNPLGTLGKTGYATGYHLHWEMRLNGVAIDPMQWTKPTL